MEANKPTVKVASLGLFILDTFEWRSKDGGVKKQETNVIGGGGTYCIVGSRMWLPATEIGIVVDRGNDWNAVLQKELDSFGPMWHFREQQRPTTRALNLYTEEHRDFEYLNERTRLEPRDLPASLRTSKFLHCVCSPTRVITIHSQLVPPKNPTPEWYPSLVYEPIPDRCVPSELKSLYEILPSIAVFSPNHEEAASFFGISAEEVKRDGKEGIERVAERFFVEGGAKGDVVIRSGAWGAYAKRHGHSGTWIPAYHTDPSKVIDVTGAGNTFMGGLMAGLYLYPNDLVLATQMASVSASFTIEQFGLPKLSTVTHEVQDGLTRVELWNGESAKDRLDKLRARS